MADGYLTDHFLLSPPPVPIITHDCLSTYSELDEILWLTGISLLVWRFYERDRSVVRLLAAGSPHTQRPQPYHSQHGPRTALVNDHLTGNSIHLKTWAVACTLSQDFRIFPFTASTLVPISVNLYRARLRSLRIKSTTFRPCCCKPYRCAACSREHLSKTCATLCGHPRAGPRRRGQMRYAVGRVYAYLAALFCPETGVSHGRPVGCVLPLAFRKAQSVRLCAD
ncbi:hypothetical protein BDW22DRAFT_246743 [Trametopsis cervina]|nr:hypothetical protein BDW22DRAFT_246743 [Trametopsis cervina]